MKKMVRAPPCFLMFFVFKMINKKIHFFFIAPHVSHDYTTRTSN